MLRILLVAWSAGLVVLAPAVAGTITGEASYRERLALPLGAVLEATLEDVSRADAPAVVLASARVAPAGQVPIPFRLEFDDAAVEARLRYAVRAKILVDGRLWFTTTAHHPVLTGGHGTTVALVLERVAGEPAAEAGPLGPLPASFVGLLPCADCPGIDWQVDLLADESFQLRRSYRGRGADAVDDAIGRWAVGSDAASLVLVAGDAPPVAFAIDGPDRLRLLDTVGQPIVSELPDTLERSAVALLEPALGLRGMYRYFADAGRFAECLTGRELPVAMVEDNAALERAYLQARPEPQAPLLVEVEGRIALLPPMEGPGPVPHLEPRRFVAVEPDGRCPPLFTPAELAGTDWRLTRLAGAEVVAAGEPNDPQLVLDAAAGRFAGAGGCNRLMGGFTTDGAKIAFSAVASTMMYCDGRMATEAAMTGALEQAARWRVLGRQLDLYDAEGALVAQFTAPAPS